MSARDAVRLADQASFGPTESLVTSIRGQGASAWIAAQMKLKNSRYTSGFGGEGHQYTGPGDFCDGKGGNCWRDYFSTVPVLWDFYSNAVSQPDQLRQRVSFALQQIVVVSGTEIAGTYGFRYYYNTLLDNAFGNYREVLKKVVLSPVMGDYLNNVNNDKNAPNENFARELLQLFSIGTCELNLDGSFKGGKCAATYTNEIVRNYAFALSGWTFPDGGRTSYGCYPSGANCRYYDGDMVAIAKYHDSNSRDLLSNVALAGGHTSESALGAVLDSLMAHPNMAPFIGKQLIQHLVSSNPSPGYIGRVASAFNAGRYAGFGTGVRGDLAATVAAVLLDAEARGDTLASANVGRLREPAQVFAGVLRALNGKTDGDSLSWWWGETLQQHLFRPPSVFNYYPPDYPVAGTSLVGPVFGIHNANTALGRLNYLTYLLDWNGSAPSTTDTTLARNIGTRVDLSAFAADAADAGVLVDRLSMLALGQLLPTTARTEVIKAVSWWNASNNTNGWKNERVKTAAYLVFASPNYQVQR